MNRSFHCIALFLLMLAGIVTQSPAQQQPIANPVLFDINPLVTNGEGEWSWSGPFTSLGNDLIIAGENGTNTALYGIDATAVSPNPRLIKGFLGAFAPVNMNGTVYFEATPTTAIGSELHKSNGTTAGTILVRDLLTSKNSYTSGRPRQYRGFGNGTTVFAAAWGTYQDRPGWYFPIHGIYVTDGTSTGTLALSANKTTYVTSLTVHNGTAYFFAQDYLKGSPPKTKYGYELWKSNGTATGTVMVKDIYPGIESGCFDRFSTWWWRDASRLVPVGNDLYFAANDGVSGWELWKTNGTAAGTIQVADINPLAASSAPAWLTVMNDIVYFGGHNGSDGDKLMRYVPATNQVEVVADIHPGTGPNDNSNINWITAVDGRLFFSAFNPETGQELYMSDGIPVANGGRTTFVADIYPGANGSYPNISWPATPNWSAATLVDVHTADDHRFFSHNGWIYFPADDGTHGIEMWRSNGTVTQLLTDINKDPLFNIGSSDIPYTMCVVNNKLFFHGYDKPHGWEPYMIDLATLPKSAGERQAAPSSLALEQNYPNPFGSASMQSTAITFSLPESAPVRISIHDMLGREAAVVVEGVRPAGTQSISFNASGLPAGSYVCRLEAQGAVRTRMMHIVR